MAAAAPAGIEQVGSATSATKAWDYNALTTGSRTLGSGTNSLLLAVIAWRDDAGDDTISGVTFDPGGANEQAFTYYGRYGTDLKVEFWYILDTDLPKGQSGTISCNRTTTSNEWAGHIIVTEWTGVDQTTPLENGTSANGDSATPSVAITSAVGNVVVDGLSTFAGAATADASQTSIYSADSTGGQILGASSKENGAASVTMSWSISSTYWRLGGVSINSN